MLCTFSFLCGGNVYALDYIISVCATFLIYISVIWYTRIYTCCTIRDSMWQQRIHSYQQLLHIVNQWYSHESLCCHIVIILGILCSSNMKFSGARPTHALKILTIDCLCAARAFTTGVCGGASGALSK